MIQIWLAIPFPMSFPRRYWIDRILLITKPLITFEPKFLNKKPDYLVDEVTASGSLSPYFGNPAIPVGPVAFRPTIARGLALSAMLVLVLSNILAAISMPK